MSKKPPFTIITRTEKARPSAPSKTKKSTAEPQSIADVIRSLPKPELPTSVITASFSPKLTWSEIQNAKESPQHGDLNGAIRALSKKHIEKFLQSVKESKNHE